MPVPLRGNKADAKYNVTTDFPHLGLHSAAATGNIGLVKYALSHGQPINSVLDGVLPLHAACSGGNELVVKLLIQHGADVNAPRLPRRYSNDRHRDASAPIVGTSGSTPLHFAAANGHARVISTLLHHGAHANRADKHGVTPEMLARQNGQLECADVLMDWLLNKDKDLRERRGTQPGDLPSASRARGPGRIDLGEGSSRKRVQVKRSIDNALTIWKSTSSSPRPAPPPTATRCQSNPPSPASTPFGQYSFYPVDSVSNPDLSDRRPSLPQFSLAPPTQPASSSSDHRRPRSAGMDAEQSPTSQRSYSRKLGSKYSLLHLFKKGQASPEPYLTPERPYGNKLSAASASALPIPIPGSGSPLSSPNNIPLPSSSSPSESSPLARYRSRIGSDTSMHHALARQQTRDRSASGASGSALFDDEVVVERSSSPLIPQGILRSHSRSVSSGQSSVQLGAKSSFRALRFESSSSSISKAYASGRFHRDSNAGSSPAGGLRGSISTTSLQRRDEASPRRRLSKRVPESAPAAARGFGESPAAVADPEEDEEEYGKQITRPHDVAGAPDAPLAALRVEGRPRGQSFTSSSSSLSPLIPPDAETVSNGTEFPFSINQPPPLDMDGQHLAVPVADNRTRGDSVSSASTDGSNNPQLSSSGTTGSSITTPGLSPLHTTLRDPRPSLKPPELTLFEASPVTEEGFLLSSDTLRTGLSERRARNPLDISIRSISSHAQAEALVQRAQKSILEMGDQLAPQDEPLKSAGLDGGWTPLSAKLAAYGESLAIERRLKREEEARRLNVESAGEACFEETQAAILRDGVQSAPVGGSPVGKSRRAGLERQFSLDPCESCPRTKVCVPKRPNTSGGLSSESLASPSAQGSGSSHSPTTQSQSHATPPADSPLGAYTGRTVSPAPARPPRPHAPTGADAEYRYHAARPRTPDVPGLARSPSGDGELVALSRVSTAPTAGARHMASLNKLTRMGFAAQPDVAGARAQGAAGGRRFGLKSLMHTLTGKS